MGSIRPVAKGCLALLLLAAGSVRAEMPPAERLVAEARAFMEQYGRELRAADRAAVADRYDPRGYYRVGHGRNQLVSKEETRTRYLTKWNPPEEFAWKDLVYEVVGPEAVIVTGLFEWKGSGKPASTCSYTGLLTGGPAKLVIRLEDESCALPPVPPPLPPTPAK
jgi:hypothetical protein